MAYYVGIDVGDVRVGLSISDKTKKIAFPLNVINRKNNSFGFNKIKKLLEGKEVEAFVVGLPIRSNGVLGEQGKKVLQYIESLKSYFPYEVITWDERYSTALAEKYLLESKIKRENRRKLIDKVAAQVILQSFLDNLNKK